MSGEQTIGGRTTGLSFDGFDSIQDFYTIPVVAPGYVNSQYTYMPSAEDPFGGTVDILPDSEPQPLLQTPISEINFKSPLVIGAGLLILALILK